MDAHEPAREMCEKKDLKRKSPMGEKIDPPTKNPCHHGLHPSPPTDAVASVTEIYNNRYSNEQTDQLVVFIKRVIRFIENQSRNTNSKSEKEEWVANVRDSIDIAAKTVDIIFEEIGDLSTSDPGRSTDIIIHLLNQMPLSGQRHVAFIGLSAAAFAAECYLNVSSTRNRSKNLLMKIFELARDIKQFCNVIPDEGEKQWKAVGIIVEAVVHCWLYLQEKVTKKARWERAAEALIKKINEQLAEVKQALSPRQARSAEGLLDFIPVGIEDQVEKVKALLDVEGRERALAVNICGFGGNGKSTVARRVVQSLCLAFSAVESFRWCVVIVDKTTSNKNSHIMHLQNIIIGDFGEHSNCCLRDPGDGREEIKKLLGKKDSLLLLLIDDIVQRDDITHLLPKDLQPGNEGAKLRIIITSGQRNVNEKLDIICKNYEVKGLSVTHSKSLLRETIMKGPVQEENQVVNWNEESAIHKVAAACKGVPCVLSAFGEYLRSHRNMQCYEESLKLLEDGDFYFFQDQNLGEKILFMYHEIKDVNVQDLLLDICTKYNGDEWNKVTEIEGFRQLEDLHARMLVSKSEEAKLIVPEILQLLVKKLRKSTR